MVRTLAGRGRLEISKADLVLTEIKLGIDVLQKDVTDDPKVYIDGHNQSLIQISQKLLPTVAATGQVGKAPFTSVRSLTYGPHVERAGRDTKALAAKRQAHHAAGIAGI